MPTANTNNNNDKATQRNTAMTVELRNSKPAKCKVRKRLIMQTAFQNTGPKTVYELGRISSLYPGVYIRRQKIT